MAADMTHKVEDVNERGIALQIRSAVFKRAAEALAMRGRREPLEIGD